MLAFHRVLGLVVAAVFLLVFLRGVVGWAGNRHPGGLFWRLVTAGQVGVAVHAASGALLFLSGRRAPDLLHYAYGAFPVLVLVVAHRWSRRLEGLEWAAFSVAGLFIFGLMVRGFMTGSG